MQRTPLLALLAVSGLLAAQEIPGTKTCERDASAVERFLPVELITGAPLPADETLRLEPLDRRYPFVAVRAYSPSEPPANQETSFTGPVEHKGPNGQTMQAYDRVVPGATERMAITADGQALGRVFDERIGLISNEAKFPLGRWKQDETRHFTTTWHTSRGDRTRRTSITIEKLSCRFDDTAGAVQIRWRLDGGQRGDYGYTFAPGKGLVQVVVYRSAGG